MTLPPPISLGSSREQIKNTSAMDPEYRENHVFDENHAERNNHGGRIRFVSHPGLSKRIAKQAVQLGRAVS